MSKEYLLDTHVWLWSLLEPERLRKKTRALLTARRLHPLAVPHFRVGNDAAGRARDARARHQHTPSWIQDAIVQRAVSARRPSITRSCS